MKKNSLSLCLLLLLAVLLCLSSVSGILVSLDHGCAHNDCPVCTFVFGIRQLLYYVCLAALCKVSFGVPDAYRRAYPYPTHIPSPMDTTPVELKVKLSN